jgi:hypothetical protein
LGTNIIWWNSGGYLINNTYLRFGSATATENQASILVTNSGTGVIMTLVVKLSSSPGTGNSRTFTIYKNGIATALSVTISNTATQGSNTTDTVNVTQFDTFSLGHTISGTPTASVGIISVNLS